VAKGAKERKFGNKLKRAFTFKGKDKRAAAAYELEQERIRQGC
jgi:hypothetical protein